MRSDFFFFFWTYSSFFLFFDSFFFFFFHSETSLNGVYVQFLVSSVTCAVNSSREMQDLRYLYRKDNFSSKAQEKSATTSLCISYNKWLSKSFNKARMQKINIKRCENRTPYYYAYAYFITSFSIIVTRACITDNHTEASHYTYMYISYYIDNHFFYLISMFMLCFFQCFFSSILPFHYIVIVRSTREQRKLLNPNSQGIFVS